MRESIRIWDCEHPCSIAQLCLTLCHPMDCSPPGFSVDGISQARILEWVATSYSRGSSWPRQQTRVSWLAGGFFTTEPPGKPSWMGLVSFIKETTEWPLALLSYEDTWRVSEPESRFPADTESASTLILDFPASRTMRNKFSAVYKPPLPPVFCYSTWNGLRHMGKWISVTHRVGYSVYCYILGQRCSIKRKEGFDCML